MCGIAGVITPAYTEGTREAVRQASGRLDHRGPDGSGALSWPPVPEPRRPFVALAHRRLAILDSSPEGHQPMVTADGRFALILNGAICNFPELRRELQSLGHRFHSRSDTEVLLEGFAEWGPAVLPRLIGMFAFAVYDSRDHRLFLARDPFGIKPLYHARSASGIAFASEIDALLEFPGVSRTVNPQRLFDFLDHDDTDESAETLFADIRQLQPGHYLDIPLAVPHGATPVQYWAPDLTRELDLSFPDAADRLRELFLDSVWMHLRSDVPLGFALSGGVDSSSVLCAARNLLGPGAELLAFTYATDDASITEGPYPAIAARAAGARLFPVTVSPYELPEAYPGLQRLQGEPIQGPTIHAQYRVFEAARDQGVKVILEGQGSDEMLAGYDGFVVGRIVSLLRRGQWGEAMRRLARFPARATNRKALALGVLRQVLPRAPLDALAAFRRGRRWRTRAMRAPWFADQGVLAGPAWRIEGSHGLREMLYHTLKENPLQALLRYGDRNAMGLSIENRAPFLAPPLVEFVYALPEDYIISVEGSKKAVFRRAMRGLVPDEVLDRQDKIGFATPAGTWLLALRPWVERQLPMIRALPCMDGVRVDERWAAVQRNPHAADAIRIWRWISLSLWAEQRAVRFD